MSGEPFPTTADHALADAARAVVTAFETELRELPAHQRISLQLLDLALNIVDNNRRLAGPPAVRVPTPAANPRPATIHLVERT